jgi:hypothetical protein
MACSGIALPFSHYINKKDLMTVVKDMTFNNIIKHIYTQLSNVTAGGILAIYSYHCALKIQRTDNYATMTSAGP